jgi:cytochrome b561
LVSYLSGLPSLLSEPPPILTGLCLAGRFAALPPTFLVYPTRVAHGYIATLLAGFIVLHMLAAFYHQFARKDGLFRRMFFGRRVSNPSAAAE